MLTRLLHFSRLFPPTPRLSAPLRASCCLIICGLALASSGQEPQPQTTIRKQVDLVLVDLLLTDARGGTLNGLRPIDVELLDEDSPQEIVHFSQDEIPLAIALLVDASGSMTDQLGLVSKALVGSLEALKPEDRVALLSFRDTAKLQVGLTRDFDKAARRIARLNGDGGPTNIEDAVFKAAQYLRKQAPQSRRIVILVSDMVASRKEKKPISLRLMDSEVALFAIQVRLRDLPGSDGAVVLTEQHILASYLLAPPTPLVREWATASGGVVANVDRQRAIQPAVEHLIQMLRTRYTLGYYPNPPGKPGSIRKIELRLKNSDIEKAMPGAILGYRNRYRVPPAEPSNPRRKP